MNRRHFIKTGSLALAVSTQSCARRATSAGRVSITEAFDREIDSFMSARTVPGSALAVVKDRRLVYARGYGWADREQQVPVKPDSPFRIASVSKPILPWV